MSGQKEWKRHWEILVYKLIPFFIFLFSLMVLDIKQSHSYAWQKTAASATTVELLYCDFLNISWSARSWSVCSIKSCSKQSGRNYTCYKKILWSLEVLLHIPTLSNIKIFTCPRKTRTFIVPYLANVFLDFQFKFGAEALLDQDYVQKYIYVNTKIYKNTIIYKNININTIPILYEVNFVGKKKVNINTKVICVFTSTLEKIAINILYCGVYGRPSWNTSRSNIRVIFRINILQSFPWHSWMKFCSKYKKINKQGHIKSQFPKVSFFISEGCNK